MRETSKNLVSDSRGAVMLIGLFMACFLIGALWFLVGIGDAIVLRDTAQEAADAVAFSSATVHARGMNFIAALNLVMLALVAVYLVMGMITDVLMVIARVSEAICASAVVLDPLALIACPVASFAEPAYDAADAAWTAYTQVMKPTLIGLSWTQTGTAMLAPYGGEVAGIQVANKYNMTGLSFSASMIPSFALSGGLASTSYQKGGPPPASTNPTFSAKGIDKRIGLPVVNEKMNKLCEYAATYPLQFVEKWLDDIPLIGSILKLGVGSVINGIISGAIDIRYCNEFTDGFWKRDGPKGTYKPGTNGSDWTQVYGWIMPGDYKDVSENKVGLAGYKFGIGATQPPPAMYVAESEFYFDCRETWDNDDCNGDLDRTLYSMRWMVRLRRVHFPDIGADLMGWLGQTVLGGNITGPLKGKIANSTIFKNVEKATGNLAGKVGGNAGSWLSDQLFGYLVQNGNGKGGIDKGISWVQGKIPGGVSPPLNGLIH